MEFKKITASGNATLTGIYRIHRVKLIAGSDAATAILYDKLTQASPDFLKMSANAANAVDNTDLGGEGYTTNTGLSVTVSGTSPILYIFYS